MKRSAHPFLLLLALALVLGACVPPTAGPQVVPTAAGTVTPAAPTGTAPLPTAPPGVTAVPPATPPSAAQACASSDTATLAYVNAELGYCLRYPANMTLSTPEEAGSVAVNIYAPAREPGPEPVRVTLAIEVLPASGRTLDEVVSGAAAEYPGVAVTQTSSTLSGLPAVTVDNLPGQFANRQAWVIGGSRVYHLTIWPWHEPAFAAYQDEADLLWKTVTESLTLGLQPSGVATAVPTAVSGDQSEPPPAALQIEGVAQTSAVGSYCWTAVCADMIGTPTPPEPLVIPGGAPLKATFTLPVLGTPTDLTLDVVKADPSIELPDNARGYRWWRFAQGTRVSISSSPQVQADLQLAPGTYVLSLFASWDTIGSANWGFLIEVQGPGSTATPGSASGPTPSAPVPAGWATFASELGYQISYPGDWELSEVDTGLYSLLQDPNNQDSIVFSIDERNMLTLADARDAAAQDLESPVITDLALTGAKGFTVEGDLASSFAQDLHVKSGYLEVGGKVVIFGCGVGDCDVPRWDQVMNTLRIGR